MRPDTSAPVKAWESSQGQGLRNIGFYVVFRITEMFV
jgi:hypothetical protein